MTTLLEVPQDPKAGLGQIIDAQTEFGWKARLSLGFVNRGDKTVLKHRSQQGPLAIQLLSTPRVIPVTLTCFTLRAV